MALLDRSHRDDVDVESFLANLDRLDAVRASGLLDRTHHERMDALTRAASEQLGTAMAFMSIVEQDHVFFAGATGITGELAETRRNTPEASYCQYVVALDDVLVVNDSTADGLVREHPATTDSGVRAYLGVPLRHQGQVLGSFCVVDTQCRQWSDDDLGVLTDLAATAMAEAATR